MRLRAWLVLACAAAVLGLPAAAHGHDDGWPEGWYAPPEPPVPGGYADMAELPVPFWWDTAEPGAILSVAFVRFYQTSISPHRGAACPMYPSCSRFALRSFADHGWLQGWLMTTDRLFLRENADLYAHYVTVPRRGMPAPYDPPHHDDLFSEPPWPLVQPGTLPPW